LWEKTLKGTSNHGGNTCSEIKQKGTKKKDRKNELEQGTKGKKIGQGEKKNKKRGKVP